MDAANMLKPALVRGDIRVVGATTGSEYDKWIRGDPALERRFQPVLVEELDAIQTWEVRVARRPRLERHHAVAITDDALKAAIVLTDRFVPERARPDKAIDVLDEACAHAQATAAVSPELDRLIRERRKVDAMIRRGLTHETPQSEPAEDLVAEIFPMLERIGAEIEKMLGGEGRGRAREAADGSSAAAPVAPSRAQVRDYVIHKFDDDLPPAELAGAQAAYRLFGLIPDSLDLRRSMVDLLTEQVAGYFDPDSNALYIPTDIDPSQTRLVISHELVHALQHQYLNLDSLVELKVQNDGRAQSEILRLREEYLSADSTAALVASGWNGDRYRVLGADADVLVWYTLWDDAAAGTRFFKGIERAWTYRRSGTGSGAGQARRSEVKELVLSGVRAVRLVEP